MSTATRPNLTDAIINAIGPLDKYAHQCHAASIALVRSRVLEDFAPHGIKHPGRVARGVCKGVGGQHSWVVVGDNVYDRTALIIDVTLWSYQPALDFDRVWVGNMVEDRLHIPHGSGSVWAWGKPQHCGGVTVPLDTSTLSGQAQDFLAMLGPLDVQGWTSLWSSDAMQGWPSREILTAFLDQHPNLVGLVPIDIVGMLTDRNPDGLYLP